MAFWGSFHILLVKFSIAMIKTMSKSKLGKKWFNLVYMLIVPHQRKPGQKWQLRPQRNAAYRLHPCGLPSLFSDMTQDHLTKGGTTTLFPEAFAKLTKTNQHIHLGHQNNAYTFTPLLFIYWINLITFLFAVGISCSCYQRVRKVLFLVLVSLFVSLSIICEKKGKFFLIYCTVEQEIPWKDNLRNKTNGILWFQACLNYRNLLQKHRGKKWKKSPKKY